MVQWNRLTEDAQKRILTLLLMSGSVTITRCTPPIICDPQPPPPTTTLQLPTPSSTRPTAATLTRAPAGPTLPPIICDPQPPPPTTPQRATPTSTRAPSGPTLPPIICDPQPPPSLTRSTLTPGTATSTPALRFQLSSQQMTTDPSLTGVLVRGRVRDRQGKPLQDIQLTLRSGTVTIGSSTSSDGAFQIRVPNPGSYTLVVGGDEQSAVPLRLNVSDVATVEWVSTGPSSMLPLAEIRSVNIAWGDNLSFRAESPWTGALYRWMVSGGSLRDIGEAMEWHPPSQPGRYLLQLIADWGAMGIAVDTRTLEILDDGQIYIS